MRWLSTSLICIQKLLSDNDVNDNSNNNSNVRNLRKSDEASSSDFSIAQYTSLTFISAPFNNNQA